MKRLFSLLTAFAMAAAAAGVLRADDQMSTANVIEKNGVAPAAGMQQGSPPDGQMKAAQMNEFKGAMPQPSMRTMGKKDKAAAVPEKMAE